MSAEQHITLLVTSGNGPAECEQAVVGILKLMRNEADRYAVRVDFSGTPTKHGFKSAVVLLGGPDAERLAKSWRGTIQWRADSKLRPTHRRANWFIGVFELPAAQQSADRVQPSDILFETFRAGGPGGQHQNTTDSAVRATHRPSGISVVARDERSQHRNKSLALQRLQQLLQAQAAAQQAARKVRHNQLHHALERGNPLRCFKGHSFCEVKGG